MDGRSEGWGGETMAPGGAKRSREVHDLLARETRGGRATSGRLTGTKRTTGQQRDDNQTGRSRGAGVKRGKQNVVLVTAAEDCKNEMADRIAICDGLNLFMLTFPTYPIAPTMGRQVVFCCFTPVTCFRFVFRLCVL